MFKVRVIPCLDVKDGRVVKGVNFVDLRDAGDPVEAAIAYDAAGADELCFLDITATHENRGTMLGCGQAHRRSLLHAADGGWRCAHRRRYSCAAAIRRRQGFDQQCRGQPSRIRQGGGREIRPISASWSRSTPSGVKRGGGGERWEIFTHGGRNSTGIDAIEYAQEVVRSAPVKSCSPRWTATAPGRALTFRSRVRWPTAFRCR